MIIQDLTCADFHATYYLSECEDRLAHTFELLRYDGQDLTREAVIALQTQYGDSISFTKIAGRIYVDA